MKDTTTIDFVIAYVNNQDKVWRDTFVNYCKTHNRNERIIDMLGARYGGINFIYDQIKLVNKNMKWINKIYLLLSNKEQIDKSQLQENVEIVLHEQFIPRQFLPTFNSTTIEMFLWNIPNLGENFIYANDDMLPTGKMKPSDFFKKDKIRIKWHRAVFSLNSSMFAYQCFNNCNSLFTKLGIPFDGVVIRPVHSFTPMIKSHCKEAFMLLQNYILPNIRAFRTEKQHNQYIYPLYEFCKYGVEESNIDFYYTELKQDFTLNHQIVCVNGESKKEYIKKFKEEIRKLCE